MECGHRSICLECFNKTRKCPECGKELKGDKNKYTAEKAKIIQNTIKKEEEERKRKMEEEEKIKGMTIEKKAEIDRLEEDKTRIEEETKEVYTRVIDSDEKIKQKQDKVGARDKDKDDIKKKIDEISEENDVNSKVLIETTEKEIEEKRECEEIKERHKKIAEEREKEIKTIQEDNERINELKVLKAKREAEIRAKENMSELKKEVIELDVSFISIADKMFNSIEEEKRKKGQSTGYWGMPNIMNLWYWGKSNNERDKETILESYDFYEELGNTHTGLFRAHLKENSADIEANVIVKKIDLDNVIGPSRESVESISKNDLSKFVEPYILYHSSKLRTNEIVKIDKYLTPENASTPSSKYQWSRSIFKKSDSKYSFFYRYSLSPFGYGKSIDLEYLSKTDLIDHSVHCSSILEQLLKALVYLKSLKIVHRDINPENIFLSGNITRDVCPISLAGFTQASSISDNPINVPIKSFTRFHPPECFKGGIVSWLEADLWSVGCTVAEVFRKGRPLFTVRELKDMTPGNETAVKEKLDEELGEDDDLCRIIVKSILNPDPKKRGKLARYVYMLNCGATLVVAKEHVPFNEASLRHFVGYLFANNGLSEK